MSDLNIQFNNLLDDVYNYFRYQQQIYSDELYLDTNINNLELSPSDSKAQQLADFSNEIKNCQKCQIAQFRHNLVFGSGNPEANIMLIGEAPGHDEDIQGKPFVGAAGQLLTKILAAINLTREEVYIANILKCRPEQNRDPLPEEKNNCRQYLDRQIEIIQPAFIIALGKVAAQSLLNTDAAIGELRGKIYKFNDATLMVTYHPAALLRNPKLKRDTWEDVQKLQKLVEGAN